MRATFTECARCSFRTFTCIISESFSVLSSHVCMHAQSCLTLCNLMDCLQPTRLLCRWNFPEKKTGVGCHALFQVIFPTQGSSPHLLRLLPWQADSLPLEPPRKPISWKMESLEFCDEQGNQEHGDFGREKWWVCVFMRQQSLCRYCPRGGGDVASCRYSWEF